MRRLEDIGTYENVPILVRGALNVPTDHGSVANAYRLRRAVPTLKLLQERHARVIVVSHLGEKGTETLEPVAASLGSLVHRVQFLGETIGPRVRQKIREMYPGDILVLENLRRNTGETSNNPSFATELASLADVFVEDSFDTCHRSHASIVGVPSLLPSYAGLIVEEEVAALSQALTPVSPSLAIIGGAKFSTKEPVLTALLAAYDHVFVGGALANDFFKAQGKEVGQSLTSDAEADQISKLLQHPKLVLPVDAVAVPAAELNKPTARTHARVTSLEDVKSDEILVDHGPATSALLAKLCTGAKSILWNGPLGNYEHGFMDATDNLAQSIALSGAHSVVGGGDTIASIEKLGLFSQFSFVSTGGGAMLEFLAKGTLPGIEALD
jgi:phosphoglycerate kinase